MRASACGNPKGSTFCLLLLLSLLLLPSAFCPLRVAPGWVTVLFEMFLRYLRATSYAWMERNDVEALKSRNLGWSCASASVAERKKTRWHCGVWVVFMEA